MNIHLFHIFYNEASKLSIPPGSIGLDNTNPEADGWYEFLPMIRKLNEIDLYSDDLIGFLSPNFHLKVGITVPEFRRIAEENYDRHDVFISNYCWDQTAFFFNAWEQGEFWHPGISQSSQAFFDFINSGILITSLVGHARNTVASNFIIAKSSYWRKWLDMSTLFLKFLNEDPVGLGLKAMSTSYAAEHNQQRMAVFIQERFASFLLSTTDFSTYVVDGDLKKPIFERLFKNTDSNRIILNACDLIKRRYSVTGDQELLSAWRSLRSAVERAF
jgi:hypothetical protein